MSILSQNLIFPMFDIRVILTSYVIKRNNKNPMKNLFCNLMSQYLFLIWVLFLQFWNNLYCGHFCLVAMFSNNSCILSLPIYSSCVLLEFIALERNALKDHTSLNLDFWGTVLVYVNQSIITI